MITPRDFVDRWAQSALREQQAAQSHFNELCELVGHKTPAQLDPQGEFFTFEEQVGKATGGRGRADVWYRGHFAWEYKGKHRDLDAAYAQLLAYKGGLDNPPLLVVCDFLEYRVYPQWPNTSGLPFVFKNEDLLEPQTRRYITWLLESPESFLELRQAELERREQLTLKLAYQFAHLADLMRQHKNADGQPAWQPMQIARFLTKLVFILFTEDIELLPRPNGFPIFRYLVNGSKDVPEGFVEEIPRLFEAMDGVRPAYAMQPVPYFNGGLFAESRPGAGDGYEVLDLTLIPGAIDLLGQVSETDWRFVNPTIFGTLFEGALDENKRAQLGAHYTGEDDIRLVVEPVLMQPLYRLWEAIHAEAEPLLQTFLKADSPRAAQTARQQLTGLHDRMMNRLENTRVLDPACGSGNFLYVSLRAMKDLEGRVRKFFEPLGLPFRDVVTPRQLYGIEKDEFAANLARVVVWIGYLQWRYEDEGVLHPVMPRKMTQHPRALPNPICQDKYSPDEPEHITCDDAILRYDAHGNPYEPDWPAVDVIMGNPPFLGGNRIRGELGTYVDDLFKLYDGRVPAFADLVCYWYEKARANIENSKAQRAGLLATNSIRGGANRVVLERIKQTGDIFMAWSDREWVLEGAAVRISIVGFEGKTVLNPQPSVQREGESVLTPQPPLQRIGEGEMESDSPPYHDGEGQGEGIAGWVHAYKPEVWEKIKPLAREMRKAPTPAEEKLWKHLRRNQVQGHKFRRQHPIDRFIVDFYCAEARLVIELDGEIHQYTQAEDAARQEFLEHLGLYVLRFPNEDVSRRIEDVVKQIEAAVLTPQPPLQRIGEGEMESDSPPHRDGEGQGVGISFPRMLDGVPVATINADLTASVDITQAMALTENEDLCFRSDEKGGPFDIDSKTARKMLSAENPNGKSNTDVVRPYVNGLDITRSSQNMWVIDFGCDVTEEQAAEYEVPFDYVKRIVKPVRDAVRNDRERTFWWLHRRPAPDMRKAVESISRFIATPSVAKHRLFVWLGQNTIPDHQLYVFAREDDYFFGVLHSYLHEIWALRQGTWLGVGNDPRYTPTTTFETFPFPWPPGKEDTDSDVYKAISAAAKTLHEERAAWLNPPDLLALGAGENSPALRERTLTNLYNALSAYRGTVLTPQPPLQRIGEGEPDSPPYRNGEGQGAGMPNGRIPKSARDFAPRLAELHDRLDRAVLAAYGWDDLAGRLRTGDGDEELLRRLLALNLSRL